MRLVVACVLNLALFGSSLSVSALTISANSNIVEGRSAFLRSGLVTTQFDWSSLFSPGAHSHGVLRPRIDRSSIPITLPDGTTNTITGNLSIGNWVDGPGFDGLSGEAVADLAINGFDSFDLTFGRDQRSIGFALITGTGNVRSEVDLNGATFKFTALDASGLAIGSTNFSLAAGMVDQAWLTLTSPVPFRTIQVREIGVPRIQDQYFSNILASTAPVAVSVDHYRCYEIAPSTQLNKVIKLKDQFRVNEALVVKSKLLCAPVSKNGEPVSDLNGIHLEGYQLLEKPSLKSQPKVRLKNQFGTEETTVNEPVLLLVPTTKSTSH